MSPIVKASNRSPEHFVVPLHLTAAVVQRFQDFMADCGGAYRVEKNFYFDARQRSSAMASANCCPDVSCPVDIRFDRN
jgi:hypothetical protein